MMVHGGDDWHGRGWGWYKDNHDSGVNEYEDGDGVASEDDDDGDDNSGDDGEYSDSGSDGEKDMKALSVNLHQTIPHTPNVDKP